ncbi:hypothetical protein ACTXT7_010974 [Hymenolepis weldensis]
MGSLFSRRKTRVTEQDKAVLQIKKQRDELRRFTKRTADSIDRDTATIKELAKRNQKDRALLLLKKNKCQQKLLAQADQYLTTIEGHIANIEFAQVQVLVVDSFKKSNEALKQLNDLMELDDVEKILSDAREYQEYQQEITNLIAGNLTSKDDADVEAEFERLLGANLPEIPDHEVSEPEPPIKTKKREAPLEKRIPVMATG